MTIADTRGTTDQLELWKSSFGAEYTDRNDCEKLERVAAWREMVTGLALDRILEVGCNVGWNLSYLSRVGSYGLYGVEPQTYAASKARARLAEACIAQADAFDLPFKNGYFDLAFTCGVLIHISAEDLPRALGELYRVSRRYLLCVEYDSAKEVAIPYRGNDRALWKRDHRAAWLSAFPDLRVVRSGFWDRQVEFDDCTWCLFEKPATP
jgi:pseudaminic acid biosynthesis-associated methylase